MEMFYLGLQNEPLLPLFVRRGMNDWWFAQCKTTAGCKSWASFPKSGQGMPLAPMLESTADVRPWSADERRTPHKLKSGIVCDMGASR